MKDNRLIWFNGKIVPVEEAKINVLTPTSQFGANVFEGIRCYWNDESKQLFAFRLKEHIERLQRSVKLIRFEDKFTSAELKNYFVETIKANNYKEDIAVRQTIYLDGMGSWFSNGPTNMFIAPIPKKRLDPYELSGIKCCISSWERINDNSLSPRIKVGANYINSRAAQLEALQNNYNSAIFLNKYGKVAEGPGSCLFIVRNGCLITPPATASILESITRDTIITIASKELGMTVVERDIDRTELYISDEAFLCGSAIEISAIVNIDGFIIGEGKKGSIATKLHECYLKIATDQFNKYAQWLTAIY
jgi:branched-chain amino acid aminotransferase